MAPRPGMETISARLASFDTALPAPKRRGSNAKGQKFISWPHSAPSPKKLAQAGLYYSPTISSPDNTTCFLCGKQIEGWEEDDEPDAEHLKLSNGCGWAVVKNIGQEGEDTSLMEDPMNERLLEARISTFGTRWPHEHKRGWICKTEKMAAAGWHFAPTEECEDFVSCAYCSLSLDGWEPKDSPFDEHHRRSPGCPFFVFAEGDAPRKRRRTGRGGKVKGNTKAKAKSKTPQLSMPGTFSPLMESVDPSFNSVGAPSSPTMVSMNDDVLAPPSPQAASTNDSGLAPPSPLPPPAERSGLGADEKIPVSVSRGSSADTAEVGKENTSTPEATGQSPAQCESNTPRRIQTTNEVTPSPSPQSSDAENQPPSSRPASARPPLAPLSPSQVPLQRVSLTPTTPRQPPLSPSKIGGLKSELPWTSVDVEMIFAASPGKENEDIFSGAQKGALAGSEKAMSVEEWIRSQASGAEEQLKAEAERVVSIFEREGGRALRVLEGITVVE